jgi:uncharacterized membrane protein (UPF0127 family)
LVVGGKIDAANTSLTAWAKPTIEPGKAHANAAAAGGRLLTQGYMNRASLASVTGMIFLSAKKTGERKKSHPKG